MKLKLNNLTSPLGAIVVFIAMIAILMVISKYKGRQVLRARAMYRRARVAKGLPPNRRRVPSRALAGTRAWRRKWDQMSGSSRYSRSTMQGSGRKLGMRVHLS